MINEFSSGFWPLFLKACESGFNLCRSHHLERFLLIILEISDFNLSLSGTFRELSCKAIGFCRRFNLLLV